MDKHRPDKTQWCDTIGVIRQWLRDMGRSDITVHVEGDVWIFENQSHYYAETKWLCYSALEDIVKIEFPH